MNCIFISYSVEHDGYFGRRGMFFRSKVVKSDHGKYKDRVNKEIYESYKQKEKERKQERITYLEIISQNLRLPPDIVAGASIITMNGRNTICIENHRRILDYTSEKIKISTRICNLCIEGKNLRIIYYTKEELKVTGMIHSVYYQQGA